MKTNIINSIAIRKNEYHSKTPKFNTATAPSVIIIPNHPIDNLVTVKVRPNTKINIDRTKAI